GGAARPATRRQGAPASAPCGAAHLRADTAEGKTVRLVTGRFMGLTSPVKAGWDTLMADVSLAAGASLPLDPDAEERAIYVVSGEIEIAADRFEAGRLLVFKPGDRITVMATGPAPFAVVGGAGMDGPRHIWWNFVSSRKERIEQAKADWKAGRFDVVPGETEFIPLPD